MSETYIFLLAHHSVLEGGVSKTMKGEINFPYASVYIEILGMEWPTNVEGMV